MKKTNFGRWLAAILALFSLLTFFVLPAGAASERVRPTLLVGGMPFGVRYQTEGILVVGYCNVTCKNKEQNPAKEAGIKPGDILLSVGGKTPANAQEFACIVAENGQKSLSLSLCREGKEISVTLLPVPCDEDGRYRAGLWVRDTGAGIGTVTFFTKDNAFGGLGHGICDGGCGALIPLAKGSVMGVCIDGVRRGASGAPGELKGHFTAKRWGSLLQNTPCGVFGMVSELPCGNLSEVPIGFHDEVHEGEAVCRCTVEGDTPREYRIAIFNISKDAKDNKCFTVKVTDEALLAATGGIVQGMSGSPILQDGKLIGAITHVLIGDPTTGYGIFIENMLANVPQALN